MDQEDIIYLMIVSGVLSLLIIITIKLPMKTKKRENCDD